MANFNGAIVQLASKGIENAYLTDNPQITWFKSQYRRHTNFSIEEIPQSFTHTPNFGTKVFCNIGNNNGDLIHKINVVFVLPEIPQFYKSDQTPDEITRFNWCRKLGYALIKQVEIAIGDKIIDRHYGEWLNIWSELYGKKDSELDNMICNIKEVYTPSSSKPSYEIHVPLKFWFCNYINSALPIICLTHNNVKINLEISNLTEVSNITPTHYILMENNCVNYIQNEYIKQTINNIEYIGQFVSFDSLTKRLYYNKISNDLLKNINSYADIWSRTDITVTEKEELEESMIREYEIVGLTSKYFATPKINQKETLLNSYQHSYEQSFNINLIDCYLLIDYIFLDINEKKIFYTSKHEYLIEQLILVNSSFVNDQALLNLNMYNPIKYVVWFAQQQNLIQRYNNDWFNYTNSYQYYNNININNQLKIDKQLGKGLITSSVFYLNDIERINEQPKEYYEIIQPYNHFKYCPHAGINVYSFSLKPIEFQPSGSCNMSVIDNIKLLINIDDIINNDNKAKIKVYGVCYNILRIAGGLGGLVFVN